MRSYRSLALAICICIQLCVFAQLTVATEDDQPFLGNLNRGLQQILPPRDTLANFDLDEANSILYSGDSLVSMNGKYKATLLRHGQLAVFDKTNKMISSVGKTVKLAADPSHKLIMQGDGNLVIYNEVTGQPVWHSSTYTPSSDGKYYYLKLENNGVLKIYGPGNQVFWTLNPTEPQEEEGGQPGIPDQRPDTLQNWAIVGEKSKLRAGDILVSLNGEYYGMMQMNGQFQIFNKADQRVSQLGPSYNSYAAPGYHLIMQDDGNLVIYNEENWYPVWHSSTHTGSSEGRKYYLRLENNGVLRIYGPRGNVLWSLKPAGVW